MPKSNVAHFEFIERNKFKLKLLLSIVVLFCGLQVVSTTSVAADVVVQGTTLTEQEYADLVARLPEGYEIVSNERYDALSNQRASTGFFKSAHVQKYGWLGYGNSAKKIGTTGEALRLEAIQLLFSNMKTSISYRAHVESIGWQSWVSNGAPTGTTGKALRMEALQITTSGQFGVYYRGHMQGIGWGNWTSSGETSLFGSYIGTTGQARRLEAVEFILYEQQY
jgi:hypothetical protein